MPAERLTRLAAVVVDFLAMVVFLLPAIVAFETRFESVSWIVLGFGWLSLLVYQAYLLSTEGQTIGKRLLKIRLVDALDGSNPGFVRAVIMRSVVPGAIGNIPLLGLPFAVLDLLFIFGANRRCIHDYFGGTVVVAEARRY